MPIRVWNNKALSKTQVSGRYEEKLHYRFVFLANPKLAYLSGLRLEYWYKYCAVINASVYKTATSLQVG